MPIDRRALVTAVQARLATVSNATHWLGEPVGPLPLVEGSDGRVKPYTILWPGNGTPTPEQDIADTNVDLDWLIQVTCAAGYVDDLIALVGRVDQALYRWTPVIPGAVSGRLRPPSGYQQLMLLDRDVTPHRPFLPLQYRTTITAT